MIGLTPRQSDCLSFIRTHIAERGVAPTYRQIGQALSITSPSSVHRLVTGLVTRGVLERQPEKSRALGITDDGMRVRFDEPLSGAIVRQAKQQRIAPETLVREIVRSYMEGE